MQSYEIFVIIICLAAAFAYVNYRFLKWTPTIGIMVLSLLFSVVLIVAGHFFPGMSSGIVSILKSIDFHGLVMNSLLSFLLFAGSVHLDVHNLRKVRLPVLILASAGTLISTIVIGTLMFYVFRVFHNDIQFIYCLLFASLISPTDPIAVLAILKGAGIKKSLELKIAGESLFNDGVAVVVFLTIFQVAQGGVAHFSAIDVSLLFLREAAGGLLLGLAIGYLGYFAVKSVEKYEVEVMITIAMVMGGYLLADRLGTSGPLAMVVAGIVTGAKRPIRGGNRVTVDYLVQFWELVDNMLNALLFMLVGFEMLVIKLNPFMLVIGCIAIVVILLARWVSVAIPVSLMKFRVPFERHSLAILTWGGLRGGLSVALALSLPFEMHRELFVTITYTVVVFSIVVQGLTIGKFYQKISNQTVIRETH